MNTVLSRIKGYIDDIVATPVATTAPSGGMKPNVVYNLGTLSGGSRVSFTCASPTNNNIINHYFFTFSTGSTLPLILTWPSIINYWAGGSEPVLTANCYYQVSILDGYAVCNKYDIS